MTQPRPVRCETRPPHEETPLARAKNTDRSAARRRARAAARAATVEQEAAPETASVAPEASEQRQPLFTLPDVRSDVRALPGMFRSRRALWIPVVMLFVGFGLFLAAPGIPLDLQAPTAFYIQLFFLPQGLFTFFLGGFLAPRAAYLVGLLLGLIDGILLVIALLIVPGGLLDPETGALLGPGAVVQWFGAAVVFGTLAGAFAGWYRNFLRRMSVQGQARRAQREAEERARRRSERRADKRPAG